MSRSYRKHFWFPTEGDRRNKKVYNRQLRHEDVSSGGEFKKHHDSHNIHSWYIYYENEEEFVREGLRYGDNEQELRKNWRRHFLSK